MVKQTLILSLIFSIIGCSTKVKTSHEASTVEKSKTEAVEPAPEASAPSVSSESSPESHQEKQAPKFGIWIDAIGNDAYAGLGVLQGLERAGFKASKVMGTGFGCWIAACWALENNGNQAEWQATKWNHWEALSREGLFQKIKNEKKSIDQFAIELKRIFPKDKISDLSISMDCPYLRPGSVEMWSSSKMTLAEALWIQMQLPFLGYPSKDSKTAAQISGAHAGRPLTREWKRFSKLEKESGHIDKWIYITTKKGAELGYDHLGAELMLARMESEFRSPDSPRVFVLPLLRTNAPRSHDDLVSAEKRREWQLKGREWIQTELQKNNSAIAKFLSPEK